MFQPNSQEPVRPVLLPRQNSSGAMHVDQKSSVVPASNNVQIGGYSPAEYFTFSSKKIQDDLENLGRALKQHEENVKFLKNQKNTLEESILDLQGLINNYESVNVSFKGNENASEQNEGKTVTEYIMRHEKSAAAVFYQLNTRHSNMASSVTWTTDVLGAVAALGRVEDNNLSRLLAEYLGVNTMMAIVCKTYESVRALETYDAESKIIKTSGLHGLGSSIGRPLDGRFLVICLENLRPYIGEFVENDPQKRLDLVKPRLPNGECPPGFLGYAVNMITIENANLFYVTSSGLGLRETLFYHLFSRLQVYKTRSEMLLALPCISDGAVSMDGGIINRTGVFCLGSREDIDVVFPKSPGVPSRAVEYYEKESKMRELQWRNTKISDDIRREQSHLDHIRSAFTTKKQEMLQFIAQSSIYMSQQQSQTAQERLTQLAK